MDNSEKIIFHATQAYVHLHELADMRLPCISATSQTLIEDTAQMLDGLCKMHHKGE